MQCESTLKGVLACITAPAHPYATNAVVYTAVFCIDVLELPVQTPPHTILQSYLRILALEIDVSPDIGDVSNWNFNTSEILFHA